MDYLLRTVVALILSGSLIGCSTINLLFNDEDVFVNERNSEVGKPITKVLNSVRYYFYWENQPANLKQHYKVIPIGNNQFEYQFEKGSCQWALIVENKIVTKWRFVQKTSECGYKKYPYGYQLM